MTWVLLALAIIALLAGIIGCIAPIIPGPPIAFGGMVIIQFSELAAFSPKQMWFFGVLALAVTILDTFVQPWGTKKFGGTKAGVWGATIGMLLGIFIFPPFGFIPGAFIGAMLAELLNGGKLKQSIRSGWGSFLGFLVGTGIKLSATMVLVYFFIIEVSKNI